MKISRMQLRRLIESTINEDFGYDPYTDGDHEEAAKRGYYNKGASAAIDTTAAVSKMIASAATDPEKAIADWMKYTRN